MGGDKVGDVTHHIEVQNNSRLVAVDKIASLGTLNLKDAKVHKVISDGLIRVIDPANYCAGLGPLKAQQVLYFIVE